VNGPVPSFVDEIATSVATSLGDPTPATAVSILTTSQAAVSAASGGIVDSDQPVYLAVLTGSFVDNHAYVPPESDAPTGSVVTITVDAATQEILDLSVGDHQVDLSSLGAPATLDLTG